MTTTNRSKTLLAQLATLNVDELRIDPDRAAAGPRISSGSGIRGHFGHRTDLAATDAFNVATDGYLYATQQLTSMATAFPDCTVLRFVCGRDPRPTGEAIREALLIGIHIALNEANSRQPAAKQFQLTVLDAGIQTTPMIQNAVRYFDAHGGVIITASHNPVEWNGYKFLTANREPGDPYSQRGSLLSFPRMAAFKAARLEFLAQLNRKEAQAVRVARAMITPLAAYAFTYETHTIAEQSVEAYFTYLRKMAGLADDAALAAFAARVRNADCPIIVDHNGGAARGVTANLLRRFGLEVEEIGGPLGVPTHTIDPMDAALDAAKEALRMRNRGFAVVHDFDADRGTLVMLGADGPADLGPQYTCALNAYALIDQYIPVAREPANSDRPLSVVVNGNTSGSIRVIAERFKQDHKIDVRVVEVETGEVNVVERMEELRRTREAIPVIGVEGSCGGVIFGGDNECSTSRDGAMTALMAARLVVTTGKSLHTIIQQLPTFHTCFKSIPGITATPLAIKTALQKEFEKRVKRADDGSFSVDGVGGKRYREFEIIHYIGTRAYKTMEKDTTGGYKIRLKDGDGNESFIWYRDSKTEPEIYIESDSTDAAEAEQLFALLHDVVTTMEDC